MDKENKRLTQSSEFPRAMNAMLDNLENVVTTHQKILLTMLKKIETLESSKVPPNGNTILRGERDGTEDTTQRASETVPSEDLPASRISSRVDMRQKAEYPKRRFILGLCTLILGIIAANLTIFNWVGAMGLHHLLGNHAPYICAFGGFAAMIFGTILIDDYLLISFYGERTPILA